MNSRSRTLAARVARLGSVLLHEVHAEEAVGREVQRGARAHQEQHQDQGDPEAGALLLLRRGGRRPLALGLLRRRRSGRREVPGGQIHAPSVVLLVVFFGDLVELEGVVARFLKPARSTSSRLSSASRVM